MKSFDRITLTLPRTFAADHFDRCGLCNDEGGDAVVIKTTKRHWVVEMNFAAFKDLESDADYYGNDGLDEAPENIVASAKRTIVAIAKQTKGNGNGN